MKYYTLMLSTKTIRKNIGKIDGSYINTPAGKYYGGRYTDIPMYALLLSGESLIIPQVLIS
jgi:hypothetical protein